MNHRFKDGLSLNLFDKYFQSPDYLSFFLVINKQLSSLTWFSLMTRLGINIQSLDRRSLTQTTRGWHGDHRFIILNNILRLRKIPAKAKHPTTPATKESRKLKTRIEQEGQTGTGRIDFKG